MSLPDRPTSLTLLQRVRDRDEEAWRRLVQLYAPLVAVWCARHGIRGQDADDVGQEVFRSVATSLDGFRRDPAGGSFRGWLRGVTRHKLLDHFRRREGRPEAQGGTDAHKQLQQIADQELPEDTEEDLSGLYHRGLELVRSEFEARTWEAFWRTTVDGESPADVAHQLAVTPAAIRKAKSRVLRRLREEIGDLIT